VRRILVVRNMVQMESGRNQTFQCRRGAGFLDSSLPDARASTCDGAQPVVRKYQFPDLDSRTWFGNEPGSLEEGFRFLAGGSVHLNTFW